MQTHPCPGPRTPGRRRTTGAEPDEARTNPVRAQRGSAREPRADLGGTLHSTSPRRALTAAGVALVVIAGPIVSPNQQPAGATLTATSPPAGVTLDALAPTQVFGHRAAPPAASRSDRPHAARAATRPLVKITNRVVAAKPAPRKRATPVTHRAAPKHSTPPAPRGGLAAVVAFARAQVGDRYRMNATGPNVWDCSGLTQAAYRRIGIQLPHRSYAQIARGHRISRSQARPGDLVAGNGHVGIYMGGGMMVDAGNPRVGVTYRKMYSGLWLVRIVR